MYQKKNARKCTRIITLQKTCFAPVTKKAELILVPETQAGLYFVKRTTDGPYGVSLVLAKAVEKKAFMGSMPKCPITQTGSKKKFKESNNLHMSQFDNSAEKSTKTNF